MGLVRLAELGKIQDIESEVLRQLVQVRPEVGPPICSWAPAVQHDDGVARTDLAVVGSAGTPPASEYRPEASTSEIAIAFVLSSVCSSRDAAVRCGAR